MFEIHDSIAYLSDFFKFSTVSLEILETIVGWLKNSSPRHNEIPVSIINEFLHLLGPVTLKRCSKSLKHGIFPNNLKKVNDLYFRGIRLEKAKTINVRFIFSVLSVKLLKTLSLPI